MNIINRYSDINLDEYKLCYIDEGWAYFTTCELEKQWGDDWDDLAYEHNSGEPYDWYPHREVPEYKIIKIAFDNMNYVEPNYGMMNSPYSVEMLNKKHAAWLRPWINRIDLDPIWAGTGLSEFIKIMKATNGKIYMEV